MLLGESGFFKEARNLLAAGHKRDFVARQQKIVAGGDDDVAAALDGADQHLARKVAKRLPDRLTGKGRMGGQNRLEQIDAAAGKGIHLNGRGNGKQARDLVGRFQLRVDQHIDAELFLDEAALSDIVRVAHAGNGLALGRFLGDQAAKQVQLVRPGHGDEHIGIFNAGVLLHAVHHAVAGDAHHVALRCDVLDGFFVGIDHGDIVAFGGQLFGKRGTDLAASDNDDIHK